MALINKAVDISPEITSLVENKRNAAGFSHQCWGDDDLLPYRQAVREHYRKEQKAICAYCANPVSLSTVDNCHIEHIVPKSLHPQFLFEAVNLCVVCAECNTIKRAQETLCELPDTLAKTARKTYPKNGNNFLIVHPHFDNWGDHLKKFGKFYGDRTKKGAFTIYACRLNRFFHVLGYEDEYLDFAHIEAVMKTFVDSGSPAERAVILNRLREALMI